MSFQNKIIAFQNKSQSDFKEKKNVSNFISYITAMKFFYASMIFAAVTYPLRTLFWLINKPKSNKGQVKTGNSQNIDVLIKSNSYVLIDFWAAWCGPCLLMNSVLKEFAKESNEVTVIKIDADKNRRLMEKFQIRGIPHFLLFKDGNEIKRFAGAMSLYELKRFCKEDF